MAPYESGEWGDYTFAMPLTVMIAACAVIAFAFLLLAAARFRRRRFVAGTAHGLMAVIFALAAACAGLFGFDLLTYQRLTHEQDAAQLKFSRIADRHFNASLRYPGGSAQSFELRGDEWQIDARVLKWRPLANLFGFDTVYRLERISGRYRDVESERSASRSVYALNEPAFLDVWQIARRYKDNLRWVDAVYGSATFLPMADDAQYQVSVSQSGVLARPLNEAARRAIGGWR